MTQKPIYRELLSDRRRAFASDHPEAEAILAPID